MQTHDELVEIAILCAKNALFHEFQGGGGGTLADGARISRKGGKTRRRQITRYRSTATPIGLSLWLWAEHDEAGIAQTPRRESSVRVIS
jgi:hypothetical protein